MAQRQILAIVTDLLVGVRIEEAAKGLGVGVETAAPAGAVRLIASTDLDLVVADLAAPSLNLESLASAAREAGVPLAGFYPHVDVALRRAAKDAGIKHVYARSRFLRELREILREGLDS